MNKSRKMSSKGYNKLYAKRGRSYLTYCQYYFKADDTIIIEHKATLLGKILLLLMYPFVFIINFIAYGMSGVKDFNIGSQTPGKLSGTCGMGMYKFEINFLQAFIIIFQQLAIIFNIWTFTNQSTFNTKFFHYFYQVFVIHIRIFKVKMLFFTFCSIFNSG